VQPRPIPLPPKAASFNPLPQTGEGTGAIRGIQAAYFGALIAAIFSSIRSMTLTSKLSP
jgi:hypothetical protein